MSRAIRAVTSVKWGAKAKEVAASLKAQHAGGSRRRRLTCRAGVADAEGTTRGVEEGCSSLVLESGDGRCRCSRRTSRLTRSRSIDDAEHVAQALRGVDWAQVRAATSERTTEVARTMRSLADHVDWAKVQPVAAQVSSALIAAVAAGRIPVGGPLGSMVARAITDQNNLGKRVAANLQRTSAGAPSRLSPERHRCHRHDERRES